MTDDRQVTAREIIVLTDELMLASRFETSGVQLRVERDPEAVLDRCRAGDPVLVVVDLDRFTTIAQQVREALVAGGVDGYILGFAPHVRADLIRQARDVCDTVVARGAVIRRLQALAAAG